MAVSDYKTTPDQNTTISGINIAEGCPPSGINNAIRQLMADIKAKTDAMDTASSTAQAAQATKDAAQDTAIEAAQTTASNAQTAANTAQDTANARLPLAGGTMTGDIINAYIRRSNDTGRTVIAGGMSGDAANLHGACLYLSGSEDNAAWLTPGSFILYAMDKAGHGWKTLEGKPDGSLKWANKVIRPSTGTHNTTDTWIPVCTSRDGVDVFDYVLKSEIARSGSYNRWEGSGWFQFEYNICGNLWLECGFNSNAGNTTRFTTATYQWWTDTAGWLSGTSTSNWAPGIRSHGANWIEVFSSERGGAFYFQRIGAR